MDELLEAYSELSDDELAKIIKQGYELNNILKSLSMKNAEDEMHSFLDELTDAKIEAMTLYKTLNNIQLFRPHAVFKFNSLLNEELKAAEKLRQDKFNARSMRIGHEIRESNTSNYNSESYKQTQKDMSDFYRKEQIKAEAESKKADAKKKQIEADKKKVDDRNSTYKQAIASSFINIPKGSDKLLESSMRDLKRIMPALAKDANVAGMFKGLSEGISGMSAAVSAYLPVISLFVTTMNAMTAAGAKANETTVNITRSLRQLGSEFSDIGSDAIDTSNKMAVVKNRFSELGYELSQTFEPIYGAFTDILYWFSDIGVDGKNIVDKALYGKGNSSASGLEAEINALHEVGLELTTEQIAGLVASISSKAQQAGFDKDSANNMSLRTLAEAQNLALHYGKAEQVGEVANQLAESWLNGSDSAREYGIVTNDDTLYGWMAQEKGIDGVNTKLSDAAMMAYRFELAMYSAGQTGTDSLQDQIKGWREYGTEIKAAQNQLLSFEKVVTLNAVDPSIPKMNYDGIVDTVNKSEKNKVKVDLDDNEFKAGVDSVIGMIDQIPKELRIKLVVMIILFMELIIL